MITKNKLFGKIAPALLLGAVLISSCNRELEEAVPIDPPVTTGETIMQKLNAAEFSVLKAAIEKAGTFNNPSGKIADLLSKTDGSFTFFAPDNPAILTSFSLLGLPADASSLNYFRAGQLDSMLRYHIIGGEQLSTSRIAPVAPALNMYLQSSLVLAAPSATLPPGYRMPIFLGKQGTAGFVNQVPLKQADIAAANGIIHKPALALLPPDKVLWQTIAANAGGQYTYFKAAVIRADGGESATGTFQAALSTANANFTALVPTNAAFEQLLTGQITLALIAKGMPPANASTAAASIVAGYGVTIISNPASIPTYGPDLAAVVTQDLMKGVVAYHILAKPGTVTVGYRAFTSNFPATTAVNLPTLVNGSAPTHPGVALKATFGATGATAATAKGLGNSTASNIIFSAPPSTTNDVNHINGVIHRIDQVLLPQ